VEQPLHPLSVHTTTQSSMHTSLIWKLAQVEVAMLQHWASSPQSVTCRGSGLLWALPAPIAFQSRYQNSAGRAIA
jgi:hypothetical protein